MKSSYRLAERKNSLISHQPISAKTIKFEGLLLFGEWIFCLFVCLFSGFMIKKVTMTKKFQNFCEIYNAYENSIF